MKEDLNNRYAPFIGRLILCATAFGAFAYAQVYGEDAPSSNRWTIILYDSSSPNADDADENLNETRKNFESFVKTLQTRERETQEGDASTEGALNVVVFSPFESDTKRKATSENVARLLEWIRKPNEASKELDLPEMRGDEDAPVDLRLFIDVAVRETSVVLEGNTGTIKTQDFKLAVDESKPRIERVALFENRRSQMKTRGPNAIRLVPRDEESETPRDNDEEQDDTTSEVPRSFVETTFLATKSAEFFRLLNESFDGYADVRGNADFPDGKITLDELTDYLRFSSFDEPRQTRSGVAASYTLCRLSTIKERKPPVGLFLQIGKRTKSFDASTSNEALAREDWERWTDKDFKDAGFKGTDGRYDRPGKAVKTEVLLGKQQKQYYVRITPGKRSQYVTALLSSVQKVADRKNKEK